MASLSRTDRLFRRLIFTKFFSAGWGDPHNFLRTLEFRKLINSRDECMRIVGQAEEPHIFKEHVSKGCYIREGVFKSPFEEHVPGTMPGTNQMARFQMVLPQEASGPVPVCIHLAGTGDHGFKNRFNHMARPLLKEYGIGSLILENPFYGCRKPKRQIRSTLLHVNDLFVMGGALILECLLLLKWCQKEGYGPLGLTGISLGGHTASLAASMWPEPISLVPCLSGITASDVWTTSVLSEAVKWKILQEQFYNEPAYKDVLFNQVRPVRPRKLVNRSPEQPSQNHNLLQNSAEMLHRFLRPDLRHGARTTNQRESAYSNLSEDVLEFMRGVMDECTHLERYPPLVSPQLVIAVAASQDAYIDRENVERLGAIWPGAEIRYMDGGHVHSVLSVLWSGVEFRKAIGESFQRQRDFLESSTRSECSSSSCEVSIR